MVTVSLSTTSTSKPSTACAPRRAASTVADSWAPRWMEIQPSKSPASRLYTSANSPGDGADVVGSFVAPASRRKNSSSVMSTRSRKVSLPKMTFRGTTSIPYRARHSSGRSAVESVTTAKRRLEVTPSALFDREDERVVLLAAVLDLDLEAGEVGADRRLQEGELVIAGALAAVDGDQLVRVGAELAERLVHDLGVIGARELELLVDEADHVPLLDLEPVRARVAHGVCDLDRLHPLGLGLHGCGVVGPASLRPEGDHRRHSLRNAVSLDDVDRLLGQAGHLAGGKDHVAVVGQEHDLVVGDAFDGGQHVLRARVHRLPALDDRVHAQPAKDVDQAAAGDHGYEADAIGARRPSGRGLAVEDAFVLRRHVTDVELEQLAEAACQGDDPGRVVGVHVDLDELGLADDEHRVAQRLDLAPNEVELEALALDEELRAVAPTAFGQVERDLRRFGLGGDPVDVERVGLLERLQHALEDDLQPESAGVDDASVAQDLQLAGGLDDRRPGARRGGGDDAWHRGVGIAGGGGGGAAGLPRHGEDGALGRLVDRTIGGVGRLFEGIGELSRRQRALALDGARETAKDLGQDDPRVPTRAHQAAMRRELGDLADLGRIRLLDVLDGGLQSQQHVGPGIPVGHREHVEAVHLLVVCRQPAEASQQGLLEERPIHPGRPTRGDHGQRRSSLTPWTFTLTSNTGTFTARSTSNFTVS